MTGRILVCGGRDFADPVRVAHVLHLFAASACIIEGGARGADRLAREWAQANDLMVRTFFADWQRYGKAAGPLRNARMLAEGKPELVVAFAGGRGTADMVRQAKAAGGPVIEVPA